MQVISCTSDGRRILSVFSLRPNPLASEATWIKYCVIRSFDLETLPGFIALLV